MKRLAPVLFVLGLALGASLLVEARISYRIDEIRLDADDTTAWAHSTTTLAQRDVGLDRNAVGVLGITDGSTGKGAVLASYMVLDEIGATPSTPASGDIAIYASGTGVVHQIDDAGVMTPLFIDSGCLLRSTANQAITTATTTAISFDAEVRDTDSYHDNSSDNERAVIPADGEYLLIAQATVDAVADGKYAVMSFYVDGSQITGPKTYSGSSAGVASYYPAVQIAAVVTLSAGSYVDVRITHDHGSDRNILQDYSFLTVVRIS